MIVRHQDSWRIADLVEELPNGQSLVRRSDVYDVWPRHYTEHLDPTDLDRALMWLRDHDQPAYNHFLTIMLGLTPENVETRCDHLRFATVDPNDPGNEHGVFGKSVCPRCFGTGTVLTPENVEEPT